MGKIIKRKPSLLPDWECRVKETLMECGLIASGFSGKLNISFHQGGIAQAEVIDRLK